MKYRPWDWAIPGFAPRDWQAEAQPKAMAAIGSGRRSIIQAVMGAGKSISIGENCAEYDGTVIVATPKQRLVHELSETIEQRVGYVGQWYGRKKTQARVMVACHASLPTVPLPPKCLLIIDECHKTENETFRKSIKRLEEGVKDLSILGYTATPYGARVKDRLSLFDDIVYELSPGKALGMGIVVPWEIVSNTDKTRSIDDAAVEACAEGPWPCVTDATSIEDAEGFVELLDAAGIPAGCIHSKMSFDAQDAMIADLKAGKIKVLVQIELLTEGVNIKEIMSLVLRRQRASRNAFAQFIGRGLRVAPGKDRCIIYDLPGNFERLRLSYPAVLGEGEEEEEGYASPLDLSTDPDAPAGPQRERKSKVVTKLGAYLRRLTVGIYELGKERPGDDGRLIRNLAITPRQKNMLWALGRGLKHTVMPDEQRGALKALFGEMDAMTRGEAADLITVFREVGLYGWPKHLAMLATLPRGYEILIRDAS